MATVESGDELFVAVAYHHASWSGENGEYEIDEDFGTNEVVVGVFTSEKLYKVGVEAYFEEFEPVEEGNGPISAIAVFQSTLNQHGTGPQIDGFDPLKGWTKK
jgi:hypothetical protein